MAAEEGIQTIRLKKEARQHKRLGESCIIEKFIFTKLFNQNYLIKTYYISSHELIYIIRSMKNAFLLPSFTTQGTRRYSENPQTASRCIPAQLAYPNAPKRFYIIFTKN